MDHQILSFPVLFSFLVFIYMVLNLLKKLTSNPPPGPWKFPLIGNFPQLSGGLPHHRMTELAKKYGPVMSIQLGQVSTVIISSAEAAREALKKQDANFADRSLVLSAKIVLYNGVDIVFAPYGDHWKMLRRVCTLELLSAKRVQIYRSIREEEVSSAVKFVRSKAGSPVNVTKILVDLASSIMATTSVGNKFKNKQAFLTMVSNVIDTGGFSVSDLFPSIKIVPYITGESFKLHKLHEKADKILDDIINEQRASMKARDNLGEANNLLDIFLNLQRSGKDLSITNECIKGVILEMFGAGTDTSAKTSEWAMSELMCCPRAMKKAQEEVRRVFGEKGEVDESRFNELKYLKLVIKETMRLRPAGALFPRECREKTKVNGYDIAPKTRVLINTYAIHRDPNIWKEPDKFWPERFEDSSIDFKGTNFELIPFGAGKRICPGLALGVAFVEIFVANLLYHFDWKLPDGVDTLDMTEAFKGSLQRNTDLTLVPIPFTPLAAN